MIRLNSRLYNEGSLILNQGSDVDSLILVNDGCMHLYGYHEFENEKSELHMIRLKSVTLLKGSWIGDYEILYQVPINYDCEAATFLKQKSKLASKMMQVYELPAEDFYLICDMFPSYRQFLIKRSLQRKAYFQQALKNNLQQFMIRQKTDEYAQYCSDLDVPNIMVDDFENERDFATRVDAPMQDLARSLRTFRKKLRQGTGSGHKKYDPTTLKNAVEIFSNNNIPFPQVIEPTESNQKTGYLLQ